MQRCGHGGFTLLELAIVLIIIGLVVGGILVGRDLIEMADIHKQISQIDQFKVAITTFKTKYNGIPGDLNANDAANLGMAARSGNPGDGDGDGILESCSGILPNNAPNSSAAFLGCESALFWQDLSFAKLIPASFSATIPVDTVLDVTSKQLDTYLPIGHLGSDPHAGQSHIAAFSDPNVNGGSADLPQCNQHICLALVPLAAASANALFGFMVDDPSSNFMPAGISPTEAFAIDSKMDDGSPLTGAVMGGGVDGIDKRNVNIVNSASSDFGGQFVGYGTAAGGSGFWPTNYPCLVMNGDGTLAGDYSYAVQSTNAACSMNVVAY